MEKLHRHESDYSPVPGRIAAALGMNLKMGGEKV
jgi:hypothetical protein